MITAVDTNVLLDVLIPNARFAERSQQKLDEALEQGALVIGEVVYAELASQFPSADELNRFLSDTRIRLLPSSPEALQAAARAWKRYTRRRKKGLQCPRCGIRRTVRCPRCDEDIPVRQHILSDFLVGAHALIQADRLLTRDLGFYRSYFPDLVIVSP